MSRPLDKILRRIPNLFPFLLVLTCLGVLPSSHHSLEAVRAFGTLLITPVLLPVCGLLSQKLSATARRLSCQTSGLLVLYAAMSVLTFWAKAAGHGAPFQLFTHVGEPWFFLVMAECYVGAWVLEEISQRYGVKKRVLFTAVSILSVFVGYLPLYRDILCLGRLTLCFPLFLMGRWMDPYVLRKLLQRKKYLKAVGILLPVTLFCLSWFLTDGIMGVSEELLGILPYGKAAWWFVCTAGLLRALQLGGGVVLPLSLLSLMPERNVPVLSTVGRRFYVGYFFHAPVIYLLAAWVNDGSTAVDILRMALVVLLPLLLSTSPFQYPVRRLAR